MPDEHLLARLWAMIESRKADEAAGGPVAEWLRSPEGLRRKVSEVLHALSTSHEAVVNGRDTKDRVSHDAADLLFHSLILLASIDVTPAEVFASMERRYMPGAGTARKG